LDHIQVDDDFLTVALSARTDCEADQGQLGGNRTLIRPTWESRRSPIAARTVLSC
jgi:hypothetical protein